MLQSQCNSVVRLAEKRMYHASIESVAKITQDPLGTIHILDISIAKRCKAFKARASGCNTYCAVQMSCVDKLRVKFPGGSHVQGRIWGEDSYASWEVRTYVRIKHKNFGYQIIEEEKIGLLLWDISRLPSVIGQRKGKPIEHIATAAEYRITILLPPSLDSDNVSFMMSSRCFVL